MLATYFLVTTIITPSPRGAIRCGPPPRLMAVEREPRADQSGRLALSALASLGTLETAAITSDKLFNSGIVLDKLCGTGGGCSDVLSSPWASVGTVPLSLFGAVAYLSMTILAVAPLLSSEDTGSDAEEASLATSALVFGSGALAAFSACLMLLLVAIIQQPCALCIGSATLSFTIFAVAWCTPLLPNRTESTVLAGSGGLISVAAAAALFFAVGGASSDGLVALGESPSAAATTAAAPGVPPKIRAHSSARALDIAKRLAARGGKFYGAFWCSHCANQKEMLGQEAMRIVPYYECAPDGLNSKRAQCVAAELKGYPTWELDGLKFPGERNLDDLEAMLAGNVEPDAPP